ncbi:MAG: SDR family oxidoreductase, partial [Lentisphaeria bacterium]|nr:SDR family oxidoreductase [Lentisphaeria bacterium]
MSGSKNKVAVITGGCGDIGRAIAKGLIDKETSVVLMDILPDEKGNECINEINAAHYIKCDQKNRSELEAAFNEIKEKFNRINHVIINAAVVEKESFEDIREENWQKQIDVNLSGSFYAAQIATQHMLTQEPDEQGIRGKIIFTSSWVSQYPLPDALPYIVSKAGIEAMVRAMAQELSDRKIIVNAVAPGLLYAGLTKKCCEENPVFESQLEGMIPLNELGTVDQVAAMYVFLCSSAANYITGQTINVDGGCSV